MGTGHKTRDEDKGLRPQEENREGNGQRNTDLERKLLEK